MLELTLRGGAKPVPLRELAARQEISAKYLEQILNPLMVNGLVKSVRGARGGYLLGRKPSEITLYDIVRSMEGPMAPVECVENADYCDRVGGCSVHLIWEEMEQLMVNFLSGMTLADLAQRQKKKDKECGVSLESLAEAAT
jgi:Rrf2 family protein